MSNATPPSWGEPDPRNVPGPLNPADPTNPYLPPPAAQPQTPPATPTWVPEPLPQQYEPLPEPYPYPLQPEHLHPADMEGSKSYLTTVILAFFGGFFGLDRFYLGKIGTAIAKLATFGGFGIWWLIDLLVTAFGGTRDVWGYRLAGYDENKKKVWIGLAVLAVIAAATEDGRLNGFGWLLAAAGGICAGTWLWLRNKGKLNGGLPTSLPSTPMPDPQAPPVSLTPPPVSDVQSMYDERLNDKRTSANNEMTEWERRFNDFRNNSNDQ